MKPPPSTDPWSPERHPYGAFLHEVLRPARYLGGEYGSTLKPWAETPIHVALAFPDAYEIGMSHLGLKILYALLNADSRIAAERVFAPWPDLETKLRERGLPLVSLESARPLGEFDILGFSLQYELTFTNILNMLDLSGIPVRSEARDNRLPLVVAGGPVAFQPEPLAPFIDCFVLGDGEFYFPRLIENYVAWRNEGLSRREILIRLAGLGGIYCPSLYETEVESRTGCVVVGAPRHEGVPVRVKRSFVRDLAEHPYPSAGPVPASGIIFDRFALEIARGCTEGCRFCQAGMIYRPVRERSPAVVVDTLLAAISAGGYDEVALTSLSTADYSCVLPLVTRLMERLKDEKVSLGVSSLRAYGLPEEILDSIGDVRQTSLTFAPEAGSSRLRLVINKNVSEEDMDRTAHAVFSRGWKRCKLYFMIGLPTEEDADVLEIIRAAERYLQIGRQYRGRGCNVTASISSFVPKPHTPLQWCGMNDVPEISRKQQLLQCSANRARVLLKWHEASSSQLEGILARGDRRIADLVEYAFKSGCRFDAWSDQFRFETWMRGLEALGIDKGAYLGGAPLEARLPWDHIDVGLAPGFLEKEYARAMEARPSPPCGKPAGAKVHPTSLDEARAETRRLVCYQCGSSCDLDEMVRRRTKFLEEMGAYRRPAPPVGEEKPAVPGSLEDLRARGMRPRAAIVNKGSFGYRLLFTKLGKSRFLSHLDTVRMLPRLFRRAGVAVTYSLGFHPKPRLMFSPALPTGYGSRGELLDVRLEEPLEVESLLERLNRSVPEGVCFLRAARLAEGDLPLSRLARAADYEVALAPPIPPRDILAERIEALLAGKPLEVLRRSGKDGREMISIPRAALQISLDVERSALFLRISLEGSPIPRADEVASSILGSPCAPQFVDRTAIWFLPPGGGPPGGQVAGEASGETSMEVVGEDIAGASRGGSGGAAGEAGDGMSCGMSGELISPLDVERLRALGFCRPAGG